MPTPDAPRRSFYASAVTIAALLGGFGLLADEVVEGDTAGFDTAVTMLFRDNGDLADPIGPAWLEEAGRDVTALGSFSLLGLIVIAVVVYLLLTGKARTGWFLAFAVVGGTIISTLLKLVFDRPRPDMPEAIRVFTASFPSGHATVSAVVFLTLGVLLAAANSDRRLKRFFLGLAIFLTVLVGVSRIYLGVHHPTDVIAGWSIGAAWAILCWTAAKLMARTGG